MGWRNLFSSCAVVSVFGSGGKYVLVLHTTYVLRVPYSCGVVLVFFVLAGNRFGVMYVLSVQYSCANTLKSQSFLKNIKNFLGKKNDPL